MHDMQQQFNKDVTSMSASRPHHHTAPCAQGNMPRAGWQAESGSCSGLGSMAGRCAFFPPFTLQGMPAGLASVWSAGTWALFACLFSLA